MESTFLLHKPVIYGSVVANALFLTFLLGHIISAAIAPIAAIAAFTVRKGNKAHKRAGHLFAMSMIAVSLTGILLDIIRLCFFVEENHTKYAGYTMPSTYPARLGFLFVGVCILYLLRESTPPGVFSRSPGKTTASKIPSLLIATGLALAAVIVLQFNPWTGALWMIWTFTLIIIILVKTPSAARSRHEIDIVRHRFGTICLAAFSWWGAFQGFGPAIALKIIGDDPSIGPYTGNQPGPFSPAFFFFLIGWAPFCILASYLIHRFSKLRYS